MKSSCASICFLFCMLSAFAEETTAFVPPTRPQEVKAALLSKVDESWNAQASVVERPSRLCQETKSPVQLAMEAERIENFEIVRIPLSAALENLFAQAPEGLADLNFVVSASQDPEVTLSLKKTTFAEAVNILAEAAGMICDLRGATLFLSPASAPAAFRTRYYPLSYSLLTRLVGAELAKIPSADTPRDEKAPLLYQRGAAEGAIKSFFEHLGITWPEGTGMVFADGELIVTQSPRTLERISELLTRLKPHRQVEIEARFMEVGEGSLNQLGIQWNLSNASGSKAAGTTGVSATGSDTLRTLSSAFGTSSSSATAPAIPNGVNLASSTTANADITGVIGSAQIRGILSALQQEDGTELLSAPRLTVLSGSTAAIIVAQELRYPQSYDRVNTDVGSGTTSGSILTAPTPLDFTTRNVGVQMEVTPYVEDDGSITLILAPEVTQFERFVDYGGESVIVNGSTSQSIPSGFFQPIFNVRRLTTEVNIPNGSTVLLGGLTREESVKVRDKVPLLGSLPILGRAFRHDGTSTLKKNLVVFVTAKLVE